MISSFNVWPEPSSILFMMLILIILSALRGILTLWKNRPPTTSSTRSILKSILPWLDFLIVITLLFWLVHRLWGSSPIWPVISASLVLFLIGLFGWFWGRDFVAGIIMKSENFLDPERIIQYRHHDGKIIRLRLRYLEFRTNQGEIIKIPYSRIQHDDPNQFQFRDRSHAFTFNLTIIDPVDTDSLMIRIRQIILYSPWSMIGYDPVIALIPKSGETISLKITVFTLNPSHGQRLKQELITTITNVTANQNN